MILSQKIYAVSLCLATALLVLACGSEYSGETDQWSVGHANNQHTGIYDVEPIKDFKKVKWAFKTEGPVRGTAAIRNEVIYIGSGDSHLYALNEESGEEMWKYKTGGAVHSTPLVTDDILVFTSRDRKIYALNPENGHLKWKVETGENLPLEWEFDYYLSSAILTEGTIYVGAGDGFLYALNPINGNVKWKTQTGGRIRIAPAYSDGLLYIGNMNGLFYAIDSTTGEEIWKFEVEGLQSNFEEYGFDRASILGAPAVSGNKVVFGSRDAFVYALDKKTGEELWKVSQRGTSWAITSPSIIDNVVYMGTSDAHFIHALDLETGEELWRTEDLGGSWPSPVIAGDVLYSGNYRSEIFALDRHTGTMFWKFRTGFDNLATALPGDRMLYTGSDDGYFYALSGLSDTKKDTVVPNLAVHWEPVNARIIHSELKDKLLKNGYELLDSVEVVSFLENRIEDREPSAVVMAVNLFPGALLDRENEEKPLLRRYLDAGGKILYLGTMHFIRTRDTKVLENYDNPTEEILGFRYLNDLRGRKGFIGTFPTPAGYGWGLRTDFWIGCCGINPEHVTTVLAKDEYGEAAAWVKNFGGPDGTGFIRVEGNDQTIGDIRVVMDLAEYGF